MAALVSSSRAHVNTILTSEDSTILSQEVLSSDLVVRYHVIFVEPAYNHEKHLALSTSVHMQSLIASIKSTSKSQNHSHHSCMNIFVEHTSPIILQQVGI